MRGMITALMLWAAVAAGQVMEFDGVDQYVRCIGDNIPTADPSLTLAAWVNIDAWDDSVWSTIISKWDATNGEGFLFGITGDTRTPLGRLSLVNFGNIILEDSSGSITVGGGWYHVAAVLDATANTLAWYINGEYDSTDAGIAAMLEASNDLHIGIDGRDQSGYEWDGQIDDARIYSTALTSNQVARLTLDTCEMYEPLLAYDQTTVTDSSGNGNDGSTVNDPTLELGARGIAGNIAMEFDGVDQYALLPSGILDNARTVSLWINPQDNNTRQGILFRLDGGGNSNAGFYFWNSIGGKVAFYHEVSGVNYQVVSDAAIPENEWTHLAWTVDASAGVVLYVNGVAQADTDSHTGAIAADSDDVAIGRWDAAQGRYFDGAIDDPRIYSTALTSNQVYNLATAGTEPTNSMAAHYSFTPPPSALHAAAETWDTGYGNTNLAGAWRGDRTPYGNGETIQEVRDVSGSDNHGTLEPTQTTGPTWMGEVDGRRGVYEFDGVDDYVSTSDFSRGTNAITVSAWVNTEDWHGGQYSGTWYDFFLTKRDVSSNNQWTLRFVDGKLSCDVWDGSSSIGSVTDSDEITLNKWNHFLFTTEGTNGDALYLYKNGILIGSTNITGNVDYDAEELTIGKETWSSAYYHKGQIDDIRIYSTALTSNQVFNLYSGTMPTNTPVLNMPFTYKDDQLPDLSGNGNDGTFYNSPTIEAAR